ncbi:hypothetical protein [Pseudomonas farris]
MPQPAAHSLKRDTLGTKDLVLLVLAAVAPMGIVVSLTTLSIALGTGAGTPGTYIVAALIFSVFAVGYLKMSQRITNAGAFLRLYRRRVRGACRTHGGLAGGADV